jgi:hypothetical protein
MDLSRFKRMDFLPAVKGVFNDLQVPGRRANFRQNYFERYLERQ